MKILILSDTHRQNANMWRVLDKVKPIDMLVHCGDIEGDDSELTARAQCPVHIVAGNNDYFYDYDNEQEFRIADKKVLLTHGHKYPVYTKRDALFELAERRGADIVMFGHLHVPILERRNQITVLNPGSLTHPRQDGRKPSYMIMEVDRTGEVHYTINYL